MPKGQKMSAEARERIRQAKIGERNPAWKGDAADPERGRDRARRRYPRVECSRCGTKRGIELHHKDGNPLNNAPDNVEPLCRRCHMTVDGRLGKVRFNGPHTDATRAKMSAAKKGRPGHPMSPETRAKLIAANTGGTSWNKGKPFSAEVRAKISAARLAGNARRKAQR